MHHPGNNRRPLISDFADEAEMAELLDLFVGDLPDKMATIQQCLNEEEWDALRRIAHQIRGSAGGYGYPALGEAAGDLEEAIEVGQENLGVLHRSAEGLIELCRRVQAGYDRSN